jgi:dTDP-4-amino-4,6-dideoxygalactose transaminase
MNKRDVGQLALLGGTPAFAQFMHVGRPNIGNRERLLARINGMLDRDWLSNNGPLVQELEEKMAGFLGVKHCIAMCNATIALEITARALGLQGEVILPSFTFVASAHALQWQGITPVFCDVDPGTHNIDPAKIEDLITPQTTGILGVHVWGRPCDVAGLERIAGKHGLELMFDAAHGLGCSHRGKMLGNFGSAEVFSFHATKFFNSFEGGAVTTNNDELANRIRRMHNFGFAGYDQVVDLGTNGKMNEASAAMGLTSLESLDVFIDRNHQNYLDYARAVQDIPCLKLIHYNEEEKNNFQYVVIDVDPDGGIDRDLLVRILHAENVLARRYFYPGCHRMEPYRSRSPQGDLHLPETERLTSRLLQLPSGTAVGGREIEQVCQLIQFAVANGSEIRRRLQG